MGSATWAFEMRRVFGKWVVAIDDSFSCGDESGALVFRQPGREVRIRHARLDERTDRAHAIRAIKAQANPRHHTLLESDAGGVYRWAFKHPEEYEIVSPDRYRIALYAVADHEYLAVVVEHRSAADGLWAWEVVQSVAFHPCGESASAEPDAAADGP